MPEKPKGKWIPMPGRAKIINITAGDGKPRPYRPTRAEIEAAADALWVATKYSISRNNCKKMLIAAKKVEQIRE